jgi:hypothetical protein
MRDLAKSSLGDNAGMIACVIAWLACLFAVMVLSAPAHQKRLTTSALAWAITIAISAIVVAMTGSLTYAAAIGIVGVAALATLLVSGSLPIIAAVPTVALIGLAAAFSELPIGIASLLLPCWVGLVASSAGSETNWSPTSQGVRWPAVAMACGAVAIVGGRMATQDAEDSGYGNVSNDYGDDTSILGEPMDQPDSEPNDESNNQPSRSAAGQMPDPFGGMGLP